MQFSLSSPFNYTDPILSSWRSLHSHRNLDISGMRVQTKPNWYIFSWVECKPNTKATEMLLNSLHGKATENVSSTPAPSLPPSQNAYRNERIYSVSSPIIVSCMLHTQCNVRSYHLQVIANPIRKLYNLQRCWCCCIAVRTIKSKSNSMKTEMLRC